MFSERLDAIRKKIDEHSGGRRVDVVAVSKYYPVEAIEDAYNQGHRVFGESRIQEALEKKEKLNNYKNLRLHMIGHLQTNKVKYLADTFELIHSVDSKRLLDELENYFVKTGRVQDILIQVNIASDENKSGISETEAEEICAYADGLKNIRVRGLMMIPPLTDEEEKNRKYFRKMKQLFDKLNTVNGYGYDILSMGMSDDYDIAVEEGSTMVRIGTALFGSK